MKEKGNLLHEYSDVKKCFPTLGSSTCSSLTNRKASALTSI
jgi:hypothetical protein